MPPRPVSARPVSLVAYAALVGLLSTPRADILKAIEGHILAEGRLMGKYQRRGKD